MKVLKPKCVNNSELSPDNSKIPFSEFRNEVHYAFREFKKIIDKYPKAIELKYNKEEGYFIQVNISELKNNVEFLS